MRLFYVNMENYIIQKTLSPMLNLLSKAILLIPLILLLSTTQSMISQDCSCNEYIYLNETEFQGNGRIHKYLVNSDSTVTEIGNPWLDNVANDQGFYSPHGLGTDLNGYLYINQQAVGDIRKLTCDGDVFPASDFVIDVPQFVTNVSSIGNTLYMNDNTDLANIEAYDLCTGDFKGTICFDDVVYSNWGLYIDPRTEEIYYAAQNQASNGYNILYRFTEADLNSGSCVQGFLEEDDGIVALGDQELPEHNIWGMTTDEARNIYFVSSPWFGNPQAQLFKYDAAGNLLAMSILDNDAEDGTAGQFSQAISIVYSETTGLIYTANGTLSTSEDCISAFDTDLNYVGTAVPIVPNSGEGKAMGILKECCPTPSQLTIDTLLCNLSYPTQIYLQDIFDCEGIVCEGVWAADPSNTGITFNDCDNSIDISGNQACGTFTLSSDGNGANSQCGAFTVTVNIETADIISASITPDQTICESEVPTLTATSATANVNYQWQSSTTDCNTGFTDIVGANTDTYILSALSQTTYYRVVTSASGGCATGMCEEFSNCSTVTVEPCYDLNLDKTVSVATAAIGDVITFTLVVNNEGIGDATGVTVTDVLPTGLTYVSDNSGGNYNSTTGLWNVGTIAEGTSSSIEIMAIVGAEGILTNEAEITGMNEPDVDSTVGNGATNEDDYASVCLSIPVETCENEPFNIELVGADGMTSYQWYTDGVLIAGASSQTYTATEIGTYTYTVDGAGPTGDCEGELCCPVVIVAVECCEPIQCIQVNIIKLN